MEMNLEKRSGKDEGRERLGMAWKGERERNERRRKSGSGNGRRATIYDSKSIFLIQTY